MSRNQSRISFHYLDVSFPFTDRNLTKHFLLSVFSQEGVPVESISYIFCNDEHLLSINKQFLNHDTYTDIITFLLSGSGEAVTSDIYISIDRVKDNAANLSIPFKHELLRVIFHGALHLCGYKDKTKMEKQTMRSKEDFYLDKYLNQKGS